MIDDLKQLLVNHRLRVERGEDAGQSAVSVLNAIALSAGLTSIAAGYQVVTPKMRARPKFEALPDHTGRLVMLDIYDEAVNGQILLLAGEALELAEVLIAAERARLSKAEPR